MSQDNYCKPKVCSYYVIRNFKKQEKAQKIQTNMKNKKAQKTVKNKSQKAQIMNFDHERAKIRMTLISVQKSCQLDSLRTFSIYISF